MFVSKNLDVNELGHLTIGGMDTMQLAKEYQTPVYITDENLIRKNCRELKDSVDMYYNGRGLMCYASKAFCCKAMYRIIMEEGLGTDVVSAGELYTALSVGFPMDKVYFHGNNKTESELVMALENNVGRIVVDNIYELNMLNSLAVKYGKTVCILLRIKPGVDAHTHDFVRTGKIDSKFGFALETGEAFEAVKSAVKMPGIKLSGLHCHIGSQILDTAPFMEAAKIMTGFNIKIKNELGYEIDELNMGGGFGIKYTEEDNPPALGMFIRDVSETVQKLCTDNNIKLPFLVFEPGRSIVGSAGITLYTAGAVKEIPGIRTYVSVDGGMSDNPRYSLYKSKYSIIAANKANMKKTEVITLAGRICETDLLGENMPVQPVEAGDIIAVLATGAFNHSMASNYNKLPVPPVVMVRDGSARVVVKRQTFEDMLVNDIG